MNKLILLAVASVASVSAFAQSKQAPAAKKIQCAVMKDHKVEIAKATKDKMFADHGGKRYFFCCSGCVTSFKDERKKGSKKYLDSPSIPTPKKK